MQHGAVLSITPLGKGELPHLPAGMVNVTGGETMQGDTVSGYRFLPHGEHFCNLPATITVPYDSTLIPKGYTAADIHTYYYDEQRRRWTMLRHKDTDRFLATVTAETTHFTDVINGIIKVPESPETSSYVPTGINDLKAADPMAGIQQTEAPTVNQNGTATLSFPFEVPEGRGGIAAGAALQYSSDGGSSLAGYSWSLPVQSIDIETRWGVPRFSQDNETESYLLEGKPLSDRTYRRTEEVSRETDKRFYPMVEGNFSKIVRKGDTPTKYYWEVTAKDGTIYSYGGHDGSVSDETTLTDDKGNRLRWVIDRITDTHGNFAAFHYVKADGNIYPSRYTWTGYGDEEGKYSIEFDIDLSGEDRKDVTRSGRLGIMQTDRALLRKVTVRNDGQQLRAYKPRYETGPFGKTLLIGIDQLDGKDQFVATQSFDYYNDIENGLFAEQETWTFNSEGPDAGAGIKERLLAYSVEGCDDTLTPLGGGYSSGSTTGGGLMVGAGLAWGTVSAGASYDHTKNESTGKVAFTDIDGDGLPDKVFQFFGSLYYCKNLGTDKDVRAFASPVKIEGIRGFSSSVSTSNSINTDIGVEYGIASAGISYIHTSDQEKTKTYFNDFNSDGLIDIAQNGTVFFNHIVNGKPNFIATSTGTANPIVGTGSGLAEEFLPDYDAERDSLEREYPLSDAVRMWRAPFSGKVRVHSVITKYGSEGDGIIYAIQHENNEKTYRDSLLQAGSKTYDGSYTVKAGDRIFFRLQSKYSGVADEVEWNPVITYDSIAGGIKSYLGTDLVTYDSHRDFMEGESSTAMAYKPGHYTISAPYTKQKTTDDVLLKVIKVTKSDSIIIKEYLLKADSIVTDGEFTHSLDVHENDSTDISFSIETQSPIDWQAVTWQPQCRYDDGGEKIQHIVPRRTMYNKPLCIVAPDTFSEEMVDGITINIKKNKVDTVVAKYSDGFYIVPEMSAIRMGGEDYNKVATVNILINDENGSPVYKTSSRLEFYNEMAKDTLFVADGKLAEKLSSGKYSVTYTIANELAVIMDNATLAIFRDSICYKVDSTSVEESGTKKKLLCKVKASVFSGFNTVDLGLLYRGWGQFAYNGNREHADEPIETSVLNIDRDKYKELLGDDVENVNVNALKEQLTPVNKQRFHVMGYDSERKAYVGVTNRVFISPDTVCSSRLGEAEIKVDTINYANGDGMLSAPVLLTESSSNGYGVSGGIPFANVGGSTNHQTSYTKVSAMDLNGDGYPDWISDSNDNIFAHLTKPAGMLGDERISTSVPLPQSESDAWTINASVSVNEGKARNAIAKCVRSIFGSSRQGENATNGNKTSAASVSASGNFSSGKNETLVYWSDFNGDGLPDMVTDGGIRYNLGHGFTEPWQNYVDGTEKSHYNTWGAGLGTSINILGPAKITYGVNGTITTSYSDVMLLDVNGDGLPDRLSKDNDDNISVEINTGTDFTGGWHCGDDEIGETRATSASVYGDFAVKIPIPLLFFEILLTPSVKHSESSGVSTVHSSLQDIDGDGLPDLIYSDNENSLQVRRNLTGRTNMLKTVTLPMGGHIGIDYEQTTPSYDNPGRKWVMASVETTGGYDENGATTTMNTFEYGGGYRDRRERDFYGFKTVRTNQISNTLPDREGQGGSLYRYSIQTYGNNRNYHMHDLVTSEVLYDADGRKLQEATYEYDLRKVSDEVRFPALTAVVQTSYDETTGAAMTTKVENDYDDYGNLIVCNETATDYELNAEIKYHSLTDKHIVSVPKSITVESAGTIYRQRSTEINDKGDITQISFPLPDREGQGGSPLYTIDYDQYGNILCLTKPENHRGQRMWHRYTYDDKYHSLVTRVEDAYGYSSSTEYDALWNAPKTTTDLNGEKMEYEYDDLGRPTVIRAPYEIESGQPFTIKYEYDPENRSAHTIHYSEDGNIDTYTFCDSLGRAVQTKRTGVVWNVSAKQSEKVSIVSGREQVDAFGRKVATYYSITEPLSEIAKYSRAIGKPQATTEYDTHDRTVSITLADGAKTTSTYAVTQHDGEPMLETRVTDALGRQSESYTDEKGRNRETVQHADGEDVRVSYDYDPVGQVTTVHHPNGTQTTYKYDLLGRKLSVKHPDAGEVVCTYDPAGNLLTKLTAELKKSISDKAPITYTYDFERLSEVLYPENLFNRVTYTYGEPGDEYGRAGRLALVEDASGGEAYYYGRMGAVTKTVRTVMASVADIRTYVYGATYDSWNRVRTMTYPDGEVVTYHYDEAGQVSAITSNKLGSESVIIERIGYDKDGHTVYTKLGNGTETEYTYDDARQRLQEMSLTADGNDIMRNSYQYDAVDNILGISNTANPQSLFGNKEKLGGASSHTYQYDKLNRLISACGNAKDANYTLNMAYNVMSMPLSKNQQVTNSNKAQSYHNYYSYDDGDHPSAPSQIGHEHYTYDANGNPVRVENDSTAAVRELYWDEDNRLMVLSDNGKTSRYTYNHSGERIVKSHGSMEGVYINGAPQGITFHETDEYTLYPASIISVNKNRFTKHYFIGDKRIASRIGSGSFNNIYGQNGSFLTAGQQDYAERMSQIESQREDYYRELGIAPGIPTMKGSYADPENTGVGYNTIIKELGDHTVPAEWAQYVKVNTEANSAPGAPIQWDDPSDPETALPGYGFVADDNSEEETFYYHSDHLGSTSYITDKDGNITQYDAYLPYGELLVDEHSSSEEMPYKFNGKELDEETGLYYYGARYMQPVASIWYGVDPLTEKYTDISGYVYCHGNPIILFDPDGEEDLLYSIKGYFKGVQNSFSNTVDMVAHPVKTAKAIKYAVLHPRQTAVNIYNTAQSRYNEFINSDDGYRRGEIFGETVADVAQIVAFGKPNKNVTKTSASNMDRAARGSIEAVKSKGLHRPYIRKSVRQTVEAKARRTADGRWIDANTRTPFDGKYDLGHKRGHEFKTMKRRAEEKGMTQKDFNDYMNNPDFYQIEKPSINRSHKYELKD
jgi:RHS repeat-associated protein